MENGGWIVALILLILVGGVNLLAFFAVRGAFRGGDMNLIQLAQKSLNGGSQSRGELDELRQRIATLEQESEAGKKDAN